MRLIETWVRDLTSFGSLVTMGVIFLGLLAFEKYSLAAELFLANALCMGIIYLIRFFYFKPRPGRSRVHHTSLFNRLRESSFPSIHAYRGAVIPVILSQNLSLFPALLLWGIGLGICFSRIYLRKHHVTDVVAGFLIGLVVSYAVTWVM
ncbi:MAG TPA: phosphatase PAP2 family protein [Candidatus Aenigmarchaeota archaeon]|nr:phosphatase PAP2 family protein [Candidatus Aenigmarchaeota archaeon]